MSLPEAHGSIGLNDPAKYDFEKIDPFAKIMHPGGLAPVFDHLVGVLGEVDKRDAADKAA